MSVCLDLETDTLVSCIQPGLVVCFTLDNIHVSRWEGGLGWEHM